MYVPKVRRNLPTLSRKLRHLSRNAPRLCAITDASTSLRRGIVHLRMPSFTLFSASACQMRRFHISALKDAGL